jgi:hypothetical protein
MNLPIQTAPITRKSLGSGYLTLRVGANPSMSPYKGTCYMHGGPGCQGYPQGNMSHNECCTIPGAGGWNSGPDAPVYPNHCYTC